MSNETNPAERTADSVQRLVRCPEHARHNHACPICARVRADRQRPCSASTRTEMQCRVCGCFSSAQTCWHCSTNPGVAALSAKLEWLWANCKIVYWPKDDSYPIEHSPHVGKYSRDSIEDQMPNTNISNGVSLLNHNRSV